MAVGMGKASQQANTVASQTQNALVPFQVGSNTYNEKFFTQTVTTGASGQEFVFNVTPGGFLKGVLLQVRSTGGVGGTATQDNPWNVIRSISLENIDGR